MAYSTSSSSATLPVTLQCVQENLGVKKTVASSVLPLGATINMDGTALYLGIVALFAAQIFGIDLSFTDYLLIAMTATLTSIGTAGIPSASLFLLATVLSVIGVSDEQTALIVGFVLPFDRIFLFGFSQGCMMSLHLAPRKHEKIGGVIGIAGMMMQPELLVKEVLQKPPILLVHGDQDDVVPYKELSIAADALEKSEFEVYTLTSKGTGHSIAEDGLRAALKFIKNIL